MLLLTKLIAGIKNRSENIVTAIERIIWKDGRKTQNMSTNIVIYKLITEFFIPLLHLFSLCCSFFQHIADAKFGIGWYKVPENQRKKERKKAQLQEKCSKGSKWTIMPNNSKNLGFYIIKTTVEQKHQKIKEPIGTTQKKRTLEGKETKRNNT